MPCAATERVRMVKLLLVTPRALLKTAPRLKPWDLVTVTSTAPAVETLGPVSGGALTVTETPLTPF